MIDNKAKSHHVSYDLDQESLWEETADIDVSDVQPLLEKYYPLEKIKIDEIFALRRNLMRILHRLQMPIDLFCSGDELVCKTDEIYSLIKVKDNTSDSPTRYCLLRAYNIYLIASEGEVGKWFDFIPISNLRYSKLPLFVALALSLYRYKEEHSDYGSFFASQQHLLKETRCEYGYLKLEREAVENGNRTTFVCKFDCNIAVEWDPDAPQDLPRDNHYSVMVKYSKYSTPNKELIHRASVSPNANITLIT